jgi:hypothetical protein
MHLDILRKLIISIIIILGYIVLKVYPCTLNMSAIGGNENINVTTDKELFKKRARYINNAVAKFEPTLFYDDLKYKYDYNCYSNCYDKYSIWKFNCHIGQRKLLLNEIQFLTYSTKSSTEHIIIYVGAAPCEHLTIIKDLFPGNKYILVDPNYVIIDAKAIYVYQNTNTISTNAMKLLNTYKYGKPHQRRGADNLKEMRILGSDKKFNMTDFKSNAEEMNKIKSAFENDPKSILDQILSSSDDIFIIQDYMSINLAKLLATNNIMKEIIFISDLRTNLWLDSGPIDLDILYNDCLQICMLDILRPNFSMLKFHPPYYADKWKEYSDKFDNSHPAYDSVQETLKYVSNLVKKDIWDEFINKRHYNYVSDRIMLQPWAPKASSEARLVVSKDTIENNKFKIYDSVDWEDRYYILRYNRIYSYIDKYEPFRKTITKYGYDGCLDCYIELSIIYQYLMLDKLDQNKIPEFIPDANQQVEMADAASNIIDIVNSHLRYDLKDNLNKYCKLHGNNIKHNENYLFIKYMGKIYNYIDDDFKPIRQFKLHENFDKKYEPAFKKYLEQF